MNPSATIHNTIARIVFQKILSSDAIVYLSKPQREAINGFFLCEDPEKQSIRLSYRVNPDSERNSYYDNVCTMTMSWGAAAESKDPDGNVWVPYTLKLGMNVDASYNSNHVAFGERIACINKVWELVNDLGTMVSEPLVVMTLSAEEATARDKKNKYNDDCEMLRRLLFGKLREVKNGLRAGGKSKPVRRELLEGYQPGNYEIISLEGPKRRPELKTRKYVVHIPENPTYLATVKRVL